MLCPGFNGRVGTVNADGTYLACVKATGDLEREIHEKYPEKSTIILTEYMMHI